MLLNSHISAYARCLAGKLCGLVRSTWGTSQSEDKLGARDKILNTKVARRACAGQTFPLCCGMCAWKKLLAWLSRVHFCCWLGLLSRPSAKTKGQYIAFFVSKEPLHGQQRCGTCYVGNRSYVGNPRVWIMKTVFFSPTLIWEVKHRARGFRTTNCYHQWCAAFLGFCPQCCCWNLVQPLSYNHWHAGSCSHVRGPRPRISVCSVTVWHPFGRRPRLCAINSHCTQKGMLKGTFPSHAEPVPSLFLAWQKPFWGGGGALRLSG